MLMPGPINWARYNDPLHRIGVSGFDIGAHRDIQTVGEALNQDNRFIQWELLAILQSECGGRRIARRADGLESFLFKKQGRHDIPGVPENERFAHPME